MPEPGQRTSTDETGRAPTNTYEPTVTLRWQRTTETAGYIYAQLSETSDEPQLIFAFYRDVHNGYGPMMQAWCYTTTPYCKQPIDWRTDTKEPSEWTWRITNYSSNFQPFTQGPIDRPSPSKGPCPLSNEDSPGTT